MAVIDVTSQGFALVETLEGVSVSEVVEATGAPLILPETPPAQF
jgi:acyl CoA:acetate/3-ketoacid CoA transferase beta subunit